VSSLPVLGLFFDLSLPADSKLMEASCLYCFLLVTSPWQLERRRGRILGEKGEAEAWERRRWQKRGGGREEEEAGNF
jgi:hypothetical protein